MPPPSLEAEDCSARPSRNVSQSSSAYGFATRKPASGQGAREREPAQAVLARGGEQAEQDDAGGVLGRAGDAEGGAGQRVVDQPAGPVHAGDPDEAQAQRRQRRHVVDRQVGVVHGQERDRQQRPGHQGDAKVEQPPARPHEEADRRRAEHGGQHAREREDGAGIGGEGVTERLAPAPSHPERRVQEVREGGRVDEVVGVQRVAEHPDRARHEVRVLVGVEHVRQAVLDPPQPQGERADHQERYGASSAHRRRRSRPSRRAASRPAATGSAASPCRCSRRA